MLRRELEENRRIATAMVEKAFAIAAAGPGGGAAVAWLAEGVLEGLTSQLTRFYGDKIAFQILTDKADQIVADGELSRRYLSSVAAMIEQAARKAK